MRTLSAAAICAGLCLLFAAGCADTAVVSQELPGGAEYHLGKLRKPIDKPLDQVMEASREALKEMKYIILSEPQMGRSSGQIQAMTGGDVALVLLFDGEGQRTFVTIKFGNIGRRQASIDLMNLICKKLGVPGISPAEPATQPAGADAPNAQPATHTPPSETPKPEPSAAPAPAASSKDAPVEGK